ncbi:Retrovirus-related Pol polyprotein from transposon opus, partial [Mucuna pruriens]
MVRKLSDKWRMCTTYMNLNKACPKDSYPLPSIDSLVDEASSYGLLSFIDTYSGYNQIQMHPCDESKTTFMTNEGVTYQRLMNCIFKENIGNQLEVYVDDMVVKSETRGGHASNLSSIFGVLRKHQLKLNLGKCSFGVKASKFLGFMLTRRGIKANPKKCNVVRVLADFINELTPNPDDEEPSKNNKEWTLGGKVDDKEQLPVGHKAGESEAERALKEIHEGAYGSHIRGRALMISHILYTSQELKMAQAKDVSKAQTNIQLFGWS